MVILSLSPKRATTSAIEIVGRAITIESKPSQMSLKVCFSNKKCTITTQTRQTQIEKVYLLLKTGF